MEAISNVILCAPLCGFPDARRIVWPQRSHIAAVTYALHLPYPVTLSECGRFGQGAGGIFSRCGFWRAGLGHADDLHIIDMHIDVRQPRVKLHPCVFIVGEVDGERECEGLIRRAQAVFGAVVGGPRNRRSGWFLPWSYEEHRHGHRRWPGSFRHPRNRARGGWAGSHSQRYRHRWGLLLSPPSYSSIVNAGKPL